MEAATTLSHAQRRFSAGKASVLDVNHPFIHLAIV
jgi:hypothetical protein